MPITKKLAIVGRGKMGRAVDQLALQHGFDVVARVGHEPITRQKLGGADVAIEFTTPEAAPVNLQALAALGVPAVTGTTGWLAELPQVTKVVEAVGSALVWSPNFSVGIAVFKRLASLAAELLRKEEEYGAWAWEIHHDTKKDAPSGTLLQLTQAMEQAGYTRRIDISSSRAGKHPGTHEIGFDSTADTIILRHTARSRDVFAHGALKAARWILGRKGVYTFEDVLFGAQEK